MSEALRVEEAREMLRELLISEQGSRGDPIAAAMQAFERFASAYFQVPDIPDPDGLLFQYGVFNFTGRPMFTLSFIRQFGQCDEFGDHEEYRQVGVEFLFEPDVLTSLGHHESWCFDGPDVSATAAWFAEVKSDSVFQIIQGLPIASISVTDEMA
jgi:hypothetical protein